MNQSIEYQLNIERIDFLIDFYKISREKFLEIANAGITATKNKLTYEDFKEKELSAIKKMDKIFQKQINFSLEAGQLEMW